MHKIIPFGSNTSFRLLYANIVAGMVVYSAFSLLLVIPILKPVLVTCEPFEGYYLIDYTLQFSLDSFSTVLNAFKLQFYIHV